MDDGLGLLVPTRPHGKTAAQLLQRVFDDQNAERADVGSDELWRRSAEGGHVRMMQWLLDCNKHMGTITAMEVVRAAVQGGHIEAVNWIFHLPQSRYVAVMSCHNVNVFYPFIMVLYVYRCAEHFDSSACSWAAESGHLDMLKHLRAVLRCHWQPRNVLEAAAAGGHVHVLQGR